MNDQHDLESASSNGKMRPDSANGKMDSARRKSPISILIADGRTIFRDGLRALLKSARNFSVVGEAADGETALRLVHQLKPDIVLLDLGLAEFNGLDVLRQLTPTVSGARVLVFSSNIASRETIEALHLGARGILLDGSPSPMLFEGIRRVMAGEYWISPDAMAGFVQQLHSSQRPSALSQSTKFGLTSRELEVVMEVVAGSSNPEIAKKLCLSEQTVKHHLSHVFDKLGVYNRVELALFAVNHKFDEGMASAPE